MKMKDLEKDSVRRLKIDDSADSQRLDNFLMARLKGVPKSRIYKLVRGGEATSWCGAVRHASTAAASMSAIA